jgi:hypothetical protein
MALTTYNHVAPSGAAAPVRRTEYDTGIKMDNTLIFYEPTGRAVHGEGRVLGE